ncbi:MAG: class I SAM-dependent methyltransferase, partial [Planctomycetes bacterium]|nr:class I SAM-dependent methyltransferase [Planctomycetota bacterium]
MKTNLIKRLEHQQEQRQRPARSSTHAPEAGKEFRAFGQAHVGGERGYCGKYYAGRYALAVKLMIDRYGLTRDSTVLEVGCGPGFMVYEFTRLDIPNAWGCAGSSSAIEGGKPESRERLKVMDLDRLEYPDASFDLVYSVDALHQLEPEACDDAVCEIMRVSDGSSF